MEFWSRGGGGPSRVWLRLPLERSRKAGVVLHEINGLPFHTLVGCLTRPTDSREFFGRTLRSSLRSSYSFVVHEAFFPQHVLPASYEVG